MISLLLVKPKAVTSCPNTMKTSVVNYLEKLETYTRSNSLQTMIDRLVGNVTQHYRVAIREVSLKDTHIKYKHCNSYWSWGRKKLNIRIKVTKTHHWTYKFQILCILSFTYTMKKIYTSTSTSVRRLSQLDWYAKGKVQSFEMSDRRILCALNRFL